MFINGNQFGAGPKPRHERRTCAGISAQVRYSCSPINIRHRFLSFCAGNWPCCLAEVGSRIANLHPEPQGKSLSSLFEQGTAQEINQVIRVVNLYINPQLLPETLKHLINIEIGWVHPYPQSDSPKMEQIDATASEGGIKQAFMRLRSISNKHAHLGSDFSAEMALTGSPLISPSRPRALTTSTVQQDRMSRPRSPSVDLRPRELSRHRYSLHPSYEDPAIGESQRSMSEPRYVESFLNISHANRNADQQRKSTSSPTSDLGHPLTPLTNPSSRMRYATTIQTHRNRLLTNISEDGELKTPPVPSSQYSSSESGAEERLTRPPETYDAIEEVDSMRQMDSPPSKGSCQELSSDEDHDMDDEEFDSESEEDSSEERGILIDEEFEAGILHATGDNFDLAARLISQLYEIYQQEEFPVAQTWQTYFNRRPTGSSGHNSMGTSGAAFGIFDSYTSQNTHDRKRQREDGEDDGKEDSSNRGGNGGGDHGNTKDDGNGGSSPRQLACPFNKRHPQIYNRFSKSDRTRKGKYTTCESGFDTNQRFM